MDFDALKLAALIAAFTLLLRKFSSAFRNTTAGAVLRLLQMYAGLLQLHAQRPENQSPRAELHASLNHSHRRRRSLEGGSRARSEVFQELGLGAE